MKVAWVSVYNAEDPNAYDGRGYYAPLSLKRQSISVEYIGPLANTQKTEILSETTRDQASSPP